MVYVHYASFQYTGLVTFPETSTKSDALCPSISEIESIGMYVYRLITWSTTLNLCHDGLQDVGKVERLEAVLATYEIVYRGSVRNVGLSTSILGPSTSYPSPSIS
jgi:hypothetical protein